MKSEMNLDLASPDQITLEEKVALFKKDPEKMKEATEFVDEVLTKAKSDAEAKLNEREKAKTVRITFIIFIIPLYICSTSQIFFITT